MSLHPASRGENPLAPSLRLVPFAGKPALRRKIHCGVPSFRQMPNWLESTHSIEISDQKSIASLLWT